MVSDEISIQGMGLDTTLESGPVLLAMRDTDFPGRLFADIGQPPENRISTVKRVEASNGDGFLHLLQAVQRTLNVAMVDLSCNRVGAPRLDPLRIESAGLVIRRVPRSADGTNDLQGSPEAWVRKADGTFRWFRMRSADEELDPDPSRRPIPNSGQPELDRLLGAHLAESALSETFSPAFVGPPALGDRLSRTVVYAVVPTASAEVADVKPTLPDYSGGVLRPQMPPLLRAGAHSVPLSGRPVDYQYMSRDFCTVNGHTEFLAFINLMQVVAVEFDAFGGTHEGKNLVKAMNRRSVFRGKDDKEGVGDFLARAKSLLVDYDPDTKSPAKWLNMPTYWETSTQDDEDAVVRAAECCLRARSPNLLAPEGRFQDHTRLYKLRVFVRVRGHDECPVETVWSDYSAPFEIAPWYESTGLVGPPVPLPNPTRAFFKAAKPNVSFVVPDALMSKMQAATLKGMTDGSGGSPVGLDLTWICGFSIPIITICAFFILNIFLVVLNIVFFWLPFVKICIPFPTSASRSVGGD